MSAVWADLLAVTQQVVVNLNLTYLPAGAAQAVALPPGSVYLRKAFSDRNVVLPCVQVCLGGKAEPGPGDFENVEVVYPVFVGWCFASNQDLAVNVDELLWAQLLLDAFLDLPRPEIASAQVPESEVDPAPPLDLQLFLGANLDVGGLMLKYRTFRPRGRA